MSFGTYRQYDSRWGKKNYNGSSTYATAGCGPTACANILYALNPKITPLTTGKFMQTHGYAIRNNGTAWAGIPACLKHFGATKVQEVVNMTDVFDLVSKGYVGVFLMRKGTKGGVTWTTSGHYIAVTGYKHKNGKHYFRTFDSGGRKHDGWYCYETTMKGLIPKIWLCKVSAPKPVKPVPKPTPKGYTGKFPELPPKTAKVAVQCAYEKGTPLSKYSYKSGKIKPQYKAWLNKEFPNRSRWKYPKSRAGASCDVFAGTDLRASGYKDAPHAMSQMVSWCRKNLKSASKVQNGDVLTRTNHVMIAVDLEGKMYVANAHYQDHGGTYGIIEKVGSHTNIWRTDKLSYISKGDTFTCVKDMKMFLNWYGNYGLKPNYAFGKKTTAAVKDFQKREGLKVTGKFGTDELKKAKAVKK